MGPECFSLLLFNGTRGELTQTIDGDRRAVGLSKSENRFAARLCSLTPKLLSTPGMVPSLSCARKRGLCCLHRTQLALEPEMNNVKVGGNMAAIAAYFTHFGKSSITSIVFNSTVE